MRNKKAQKTFIKKFFEKHRDEIITNKATYNEKYGYDSQVVRVVTEMDELIRQINETLKFVDN